MRKPAWRSLTRRLFWTAQAACAVVLAAGVGNAAAAAPAPATAASRPAISVTSAGWVHAYAAFGTPKYGAGFDHFEYADPQAPKGGTLYLKNPDRRTSFDKFNPFTVKGSAPGGQAIFMFESLALISGDEPQTMYGLLAQSMQIAPDKSSITFRLNPKARFYNGDAVTAADVKYSFDTLRSKYAAPGYQTAYAAVGAAVLVDALTIRFELIDKSADTLFALGGLPVFSPKWAVVAGAAGTADTKVRRFDEIVTEYPITSGPYTIGAVDSGRRIEFQRNPNYWGRDLAVRRGFFNFDRVVYRYYKDDIVSTEAFKAGEFDIVRIYGARTWNRQIKGPKWDDGRIVKELFQTGFGQGLQAYQLNLRRPIFQDIRVREALGLTYDFDTQNRYRMYTRANSLFNNSVFAAKGLPSADELKLLEPYRQELPATVFGPAYVAPATGGDAQRLRAQLLRARALLAAAGWNVAADGKLRNARGEAFEIEYLSPAEDSTRESTWQRSLSKLGITLRVRQVDFALYQRRLQNYDFDLVTIVEGRFTVPSPTDYAQSYGAKSADEPGNSNYRGVKSAAVDHIVAAMTASQTEAELQTATRALDRVVMWNHWQVPDLYFSKLPTTYWNKFGMPKLRPSYYTIDSPGDAQPAWPLTTWWMRDAARR